MIVAPPPQPLDPAKPFSLGGKPVGPTVADYWSWAHSGLLGNKERGVLAEFVVAQALGIKSAAHDPWGSFDLVTAAGTTIEVKSVAYLQAWNQRELSRPVWQSLRSRQTVNTEDGGWSQASDRSVKGDVLVLTLFTATEHLTADPLNLDQWAFWIVPAAEITTDTMSLGVVESRYRRTTFSDLHAAFVEVERRLLEARAARSAPGAQADGA